MSKKSKINFYEWKINQGLAKMKKKNIFVLMNSNKSDLYKSILFICLYVQIQIIDIENWFIDSRFSW